MCIRYQVIAEGDTRPSGNGRQRFTDLGRRTARHLRPAVLVADDLAYGISNYGVSPLGSLLENGRTFASEAVIHSHQEGIRKQRCSEPPVGRKGGAEPRVKNFTSTN